FDGRVEHLMNASAAVVNLERLPVVTPAAAHIAGYIHVRQEVHLHADHAIALAGLTAAALDVEAEAPGVIATRTCLGHLRKQLTNDGEESRIGRRIGSGRAPDRRLVDLDDALEALQPI